MATYQPVCMTNKAATAESSDTKRKLLDASVKLMRSKGFNATTVDDICGVAGVTKGGFFHYFQSKQDIAKAAVDRFREARRLAFEQAPFRKLADPLDRIYGRLNFIKKELLESVQVTGGCLVGMFAQEMAFTNPELRAACQDSFLHLAQDFEKDLAAAKAHYAPKADFDPKGLAILFVATYQGSVLMAKTTDNNTVIGENFDQFGRLLAALFSQSATPTTSIVPPIANHSLN